MPTNPLRFIAEKGILSLSAPRTKVKVLVYVDIDVTVGALDESLKEMAKEHPDLEVYYDGDRHAIVGKKVRTLSKPKK